MTSNFDFDQAFATLTGFAPFPWQRRLLDQYLSKGALPAEVDIPTGLGKTAVMAIWLLARAKQGLLEQKRNGPTDQLKHQSLPRRLVYVVDRRAVVDQATSFAEEIRDRLSPCEELEPVRRGLRLDDDRKLPISTLRGRHIDNREWMEDPSAAAIIVGTVDMIGSRLLFEGYGVSRKMRPFAAGLLGCDTLVMLDEAHLVPPFKKLLKDIERGSNSDVFGPQAGTDRKVIPPFRMLPLSATGQEDCASSSSSVFQLQPEDYDNEIVRKRLRASKRLTIVESEELVSELTAQAWRLGSGSSPQRVLVYCNSREDAVKVKADIDRQLKKHGGYSELLVGARRVREREDLAGWLRDKGFLGDTDGSPEHSLFLIATSAGEVGVDLDADHMVCDLVEWERMAQRFGRVNRRGNGYAKIVVVAGPGTRKTTEAELEERLGRLRPPLDALRPAGLEDSRDASPDAILDLKVRARDDQKLQDAIDEATTSEPLRPAVTRSLVDAWSLTSLVEHAGRPEVAPWLRGWQDNELPQTTVVWRQYLPLRFEGYICQEPARKEVTEFFEAMPLHAAELLEIETFRIVEWLRKYARQVSKIIVGAQISGAIEKTGVGNEEKKDMASDFQMFARRIRQDAPIAILLGNDGSYFDQLCISDVTSWNSRQLSRTLANRKLVVDAHVGGLRDGLFDPNCKDVVRTPEDNWGSPEEWEDMPSGSLQEADLPAKRVRLMSSSEREDKRREDDQWRETAVFSYRANSEGETESWLVVEKWLAEQSNEEGRSIAKVEQCLSEHQDWTAREAEQIAKKLGLTHKYQEVLVTAARHHDDGKASPRWQRAFNASATGGPFAKTAGPFNKYILNGYRHELQSVIDIESNVPDGFDENDARFDLLLHLIAAHHGNARPSVSTEGLDSLPPTAAAHRAYDVAVRYAKLQRQWGPWGLAWWEALLRSADQRASRKLDEVSRLDAKRLASSSN